MLNQAGHFRHYQMGFYSLDQNDTRYPFLPIQTEKQLVTFIYTQYGAGQYSVRAFLKGRRGMWIFWAGIVNEEGWQFNNRFQESSDIRRINREIKEAIDSGDEELVKGLKEDLDFQKEEDVRGAKEKKYGFAPFLRSSGKRGSFHMWAEPDKAYKEAETENVYG